MKVSSGFIIMTLELSKWILIGNIIEIVKVIFYFINRRWRIIFKGRSIIILVVGHIIYKMTRVICPQLIL